MLEATKEAQCQNRGVASPEAAAAQAAHDVLVHEFADGAPAFDALLAAELAAIADGPAKTHGVAIGIEEAAEMLAARANDGSANPTGPYTPGPNPGDYQPTPPFDGPPFNGFVDGVNWGNVTPFVLRSGSQFRAPPPEFRMSKPERIPKPEVRTWAATSDSLFGFLASFGFRNSSFGFSPASSASSITFIQQKWRDNI